MKFVYFSVTSNEVPNLSEAARLFMEKVAPLEIYARTRTQLEKNPENQAEFVRRALAADAVVVTLMAGSHSCPAWEALIQAFESRRETGGPVPYLHIQPTGSNPDTLALVQQHSDGLDDDTWQTLSRYYRYGGGDNLINLLRFLYNQVCHGCVTAGEPLRPPYEGLYHPDHGYIAEVDNLMAEYQAATIQDQGKLDLLAHMIWEAAEKAEITADLNLEKTTALADVINFLETLHHYLSEIADTAITDGLHILGRPPARQPLIRTLVQLTRLANGDVPSLRRSIAAALGYDADFLIMYRRFAERVPLNKEMADWMKKVNPYALHNIIDKLLEAAGRGMWNADTDILDALREAYLDVEGEIEEVVDR